jgi:hypothetical protein
MNTMFDINMAGRHALASTAKAKAVLVGWRV